jgi:hypothetical protein
MPQNYTVSNGTLTFARSTKGVKQMKERLPFHEIKNQSASLNTRHCFNELTQICTLAGGSEQPIF